MEWIVIASLFIAVLALGFSLLKSRYTREFSQPDLRIAIGLRRAFGEEWKDIDRRPTRTIAFATPPSEIEAALFIIPLVVENVGSAPIKDLVVRFQLPLVNSPPPIEVLKAKAPSDSFYFEGRTVDKVFDLCSISHEIPILRPQEPLVLGEFVQFPKPLITAALLDSVCPHITAELMKQPSFRDLSIIDIFVNASNCSPLSKRVNVLWFEATSAEQFQDDISRAGEAFWGGTLSVREVVLEATWEASI